MVKKCALCIGKLSQRGYPRSNLARITDRPDMISAVNLKHQIKHVKTLKNTLEFLVNWTSGKHVLVFNTPLHPTLI